MRTHFFAPSIGASRSFRHIFDHENKCPMPIIIFGPQLSAVKRQVANRMKLLASSNIAVVAMLAIAPRSWRHDRMNSSATNRFGR